MPETGIVDPHHHLWDLSHRYPWLQGEGKLEFQGDATPIHKNYLLDDLLADAAGLGLAKSVHVEASAGDPRLETAWLQRIADSRGFPHGIVVHVPLDAPAAGQALAWHAGHRNVRGVRHILNWHPDRQYRFTERDDYLADPAWRAGYALLEQHGLSFDLQIYPGQMAAAARLAHDFPATPVILNHTGMPIGRDAASFAEWQAGMRLLAAAPNVSVKISGLGMLDHQWTVDSIRPFVLETIAIFSAGRCMFASNFPVDGLYSSYRQLWDAFGQITAGLTASEREQLFSATATRVYRL
ncbi:MAG: amidohydrolase family protein [Gemmatimonadota bacterium]